MSIPNIYVYICTGEDLETAAVREVLEETGIKIKFEGVLAFRQNHNTGVEGKTDLFFLCKARPLSSEITVQVKKTKKTHST